MWQAQTDRVIDLTYAAALGERPWGDLVAALGEGMPEARVTMFHHDPTAGRGAFTLTHGFDASEVRAYNEHWAARNPWMPAAARRPVGLGVVADQMLDPAALRRTDFFDGFLRPGGMASATGVTVERAGGRLLLLSVLTNRADPEDNMPHARMMTSLAPHLARAVRHARGLDPLGPGGAQAVEALGAGAVVVGPGRRVRHLTPTAERLVGAGGPVRIDPNNRLVIADARLSEGLVAMLVLGRPRSLSALLPLGEGAALRVVLVRLASDALSDWLHGPTVLALLTPVAGAGRDPTALALLERHFRLTGAEAQVLAALADGLTLDQIARLRGTGRETVRAQLRSLFDKTGTHRQADLIRLVTGGARGPG